MLLCPAVDVQATDWNPRIGQLFPDQEWHDSDGRPVRLSAYKGRPILIEFVAMSCSACQAFSGAHKKGAFGNAKPQAGLQSIGEYLKTYSGVSVDDPRLVFVQVIVQDHAGKAASFEAISEWARHFKLESPNHAVLGAPKGMQNLPVPMFYLIDQDFKLRYASGNAGPHDLYRDLLPSIPKLLKASSVPPSGAKKAAASGSMSWLEGDSGQQVAHHELERLRRPYGIYFYMSACGYCRDFDKKVLKNSEVTASLSAVNMVKIDIDRDTATAKQFGVERTPRFYVVDTAGIRRLRTNVKPAEFLEQCRLEGLIS